MDTYDKKFKVHTILLREQLLTRLPKDIISEKDNFSDYQHPTNPIGFKFLLEDFQLLVLSFEPN